jgi:parallel beta-helix repeat protein
MPHVPARDGGFDHCLADRPLCGHADTVFLDDAALLQVGGLSELAPGRFWFDYANDRIWIADDPSGRRVEVTASPEAFSYSPAVRDVTIANLVVEKFGNPAQTGAINTGEAWTIRHSEVRLNHGAGVRLGSRSRLLSSRVLEQGQIGVTGWGDDVRVQDNEIAGNNTAGYNPYWEAGGSKWARTTGLVVRGNWVHHNHGPGLWTDIDNRQTLYEHNLVEHNDLAGIFHEISFDAVIRHNTTRHNGFGHRHWWTEGAGILISNSRDVTIHDNTVIDNAGGIVVRADDRGPWTVANITVHDNHVRMPTGGTGMVTTTNDLSVFDSGVRFTSNRYELDLETDPFQWRGTTHTPTRWTSLGHDHDATFQPLTPRD